MAKGHLEEEEAAFVIVDNKDNFRALRKSQIFEDDVLNKAAILDLFDKYHT
jgi:hypothetical protein